MVSVCIFGSVARGTGDHLSDRDLLVVGSARERAAEGQKWARLGWTVSGFSSDRFCKMVANKSLFIQHLKQEGIVVSDNDSFLARQFSLYSPKDTYSAEIVEVLGQLPAFTLRSDNYWRELCRADILYTLLRNLLILHYSALKIFEFDFDRLVSLAFQNDRAIRIRRLRVMKNAYRSRIIDADVKCLTKIVSDIEEGLSVFEPIGDLSSSEELIPNGYYDLRRIEMALVGGMDPRSLDRMGSADPAFQLWKLICSPNDYPKLRKFDSEKWGRMALRCASSYMASVDRETTPHPTRL
jgi:hypothetical protein